MENNIVIIHAGIAVIFTLYLFLRLLLSLFGLKDKDYQVRVNARFKKSDWVFTVLLLLTGLYPMVSVGVFELYHILKLIGLVTILWLSRYRPKLNFALVSLLGIVISISIGVASFKDQPKFPKTQSSFEADYPEVASMSPLEQGEFIFSTICSKCHGKDGKLGRFGAADLATSILNTEEKIQLVLDGSPLTVMRSFNNELTVSEIEAVVGYIESL